MEVCNTSTSQHAVSRISGAATSSLTHKKLRDWIIVLLWGFGIFALIPLARNLQHFVSDSFGRNTFLFITAAALLLGFVLLSKRLFQSPRSSLLPRVLVVTASLSAIAYWGYTLRAHPERTIHFVQYGFFAFFLLQALRHHLNDGGVYLAALAGTALLGTIDEIVQWFTPQRFFDYDDIIINAGAGLLALSAIRALPQSIPFLVGRHSLRLALRLLAVMFLLLSATFLATPGQLDEFAERFPSLKSVLHNPSIIVDYGYRHKLTTGERFVSRFSLTELESVDTNLGVQTGRLVHEHYDPQNYPAFLATTLYESPLAYEVRVRLFRRDAHWQHAKEQESGSRAYRRHISIAYLEHRILSDFYPVSYRSSLKVPSDEDILWLEKHYDAALADPSPVGGELLVALSQRQYVGFFALLALLSLLLGQMLRERRNL